MTETGWELWGLKLHWFIVLGLLVVAIIAVLLMKKKPDGPKADKKAGDEGV
ncbi:MAG TPA: hypothetical protein VFR01_06430 [Geobacterales bacterium]|nr:hypothetical protein [Geobacterales bacterium]